jgi:glycosyltransferase involved in cell wall biosynthesis
MFSILIPTWNNLPYLKLCIESIRRHSAFDHEIIVHVNEGTDGTLEWVRAQGLRHTWSRGNVGVCIAMNDAARLATRDWILFMNDDMYCLPGWDLALEAAARPFGDTPVYLAARLVEPLDTGNELVGVANFGTGPDNFDEAGLLSYAKGLGFADRNGVASQPMLTQRRLWHMVGGYSIEFGPGMSSDDDFLMKIWLAGCRVFRIVGSSHVYHFACATTRRVRRNKGGRTFILKWGISQQDFMRDYVGRTASVDAASLPNVPRPGLKRRLKRAVYAFGRYPTGDLEAWEPDLPRQIVMDSAADQPVGTE